MYCLQKVWIIFLRILLHYKHILTTLAWHAEFRSRKTLSSSVGSSSRTPCFQLVFRRRCPRSAPFRRRRRWKSEGAKPLFLTSFNFCTYRSERIVAHLSKNSTKKIPSLSQKTLAMTLHAEVFLTSRRLMMPFYLLSFPRRAIMTNTGFNTGNYSWQKSNSVSLTARE